MLRSQNFWAAAVNCARARLAVISSPRSPREPRNRRVADVVAPRNFHQRFAFVPRLIASACWWGVSFGLRPIFTPRPFARALQIMKHGGAAVSRKTTFWEN
jgi:hypothetical protein